MGQSIVGLLLGFAIVFGVVFWARTCLPEPGGSGVEWLRRENAIIVQMKTVDNADDELRQRLAVPELTLYGDGTVLFKDSSQPRSGQLFRAQVSDKTVRSLLELADDSGVLDYSYEQPRLDTQHLATTYFYFNMKLTGNAVSAYGITSDASFTGDTWARLRVLQRIRRSLIDVAAEAKASSVPYYAAEVLQLTRTEGVVEIHEQMHTGDDAANLNETIASGKGNDYVTVLEHGDGRLVKGGYRPILPFEANFPEFDPPLSTDE